MRKTLSLFLVNHPYLRRLLVAGCILVLAVLSIVLGNRHFNQYDVYVDAKIRVKGFLKTGISVAQTDPLEEKRKLLTLFRQEIRGYEQLSDFEKLNEIRKWASMNWDSAISLDAMIDHNSAAYRAKPVSERIDAFLRNKSGGGSMCGGKADLLVEVYQALGYQAYALNFGFASYTHVVTVVEVGEHWYIQDSTSNGIYNRKDGSPMPLREILLHLANLTHQEVVITFDNPSNFQNEYYSTDPNRLKKQSKPDACAQKGNGIYL